MKPANLAVFMNRDNSLFRSNRENLLYLGHSSNFNFRLKKNYQDLFY